MFFLKNNYFICDVFFFFWFMFTQLVKKMLLRGKNIFSFLSFKYLFIPPSFSWKITLLLPIIFFSFQRVCASFHINVKITRWYSPDRVKDIRATSRVHPWSSPSVMGLDILDQRLSFRLDPRIRNQSLTHSTVQKKKALLCKPLRYLGC